MDLDLDNPPAPLARLLDSAEETGCVNLSELDQIARRLGVAEDDLCELHEAFEARGIDVTDDCGRSNVPARRTTEMGAWRSPRRMRSGCSSTRSAAIRC